MHCIRKTIDNTTLIAHTQTYSHSCCFFFPSKNPAQTPTHSPIFELKKEYSLKNCMLLGLHAHTLTSIRTKRHESNKKRKETAKRMEADFFCSHHIMYDSCTIWKILFSRLCIFIEEKKGNKSKEVDYI